MSQNIQHRPEIDGLRAIAVTAVILFHARFPHFSGGFIGVDVFFVISGFLISSIIFKNLENQAFSFLDFYVRRINRIFPALIVVLLSVLAFGFLALFPDELKQLGRHVWAGVGYFSNFQLLSEVGYFDVASDKKPLLHLWSLAIEEQFYIFAPLLFFIIYKLRKKIQPKILPIFLILLTVLSFGYSVFLLRDSATNAFYNPLSRFWEILIGSCLASFQHSSLFSFKLEGKFKKLIPNLMSIIGIALLVYGFKHFNSSTPFPGFHALVPTFATSLLILSGNNAYINRKLLSSRIALYLGKISYPLYLWHWPVFAYYTILFSESMSRNHKIISLVFILILADLTYRLIELPLRNSLKIDNSKFYKQLVMAMLVVGLFGGLSEFNKGFVSRYDELTEDTFSPVLFENEESCKSRFPFAQKFYCGISSPQNSPDIMLLGDSHSRHFFPALSQYFNSQKKTLVSFGKGGCPPLLGITSRTSAEGDLHCNEIFNAALNFGETNPQIKTIILAASYNDYVRIKLVPLNPRYKELEPKKVFEDSMNETLNRLSKSQKKIVLLMQVPKLPYEPKQCTARFINISSQVVKSCKMSQEDVNKDFKDYLAIMNRIQKNFPSVTFYSPFGVLCQNGICDAKTSGKLLYSDSGHLNKTGSLYFANRFNF